MLKQGEIKMLMQQTASKIKLIPMLYLERRTRPGLLFPVMIMFTTSGNSMFGLGKRCVLHYSDVAASHQLRKQHLWLLKSVNGVQSFFCKFFINLVLNRLSDLVNFLWRRNGKFRGELRWHTIEDELYKTDFLTPLQYSEEKLNCSLSLLCSCTT